MEQEKEQKMQQLIQIGLNPKTAKRIAMTLLPELGDLENARKNAELLRRYMDLSAFEPGDSVSLILFLRNPYEENQAVSCMPERCRFSEEEKRKFEEALSSSVKNWCIAVQKQTP